MIDTFVLFFALKTIILSIAVYLIGFKILKLGAKTCALVSIFLTPTILFILEMITTSDMYSEIPRKGITNGWLVDLLWMVALCAPFSIIGWSISKFGILRFWK